MESSVKIDLTGWKNLVKNLKSLQNTVKVGIFNDEENATKAARNEFGVMSENIPSRPFMRKSIELLGERAVNKSLENIDLTKSQGNNKILSSLGQNCANNMVEMIDSSSDYFEANAPSTAIEKGFNHPLLDTGEMRDAITYKISEETNDIDVPF